MRKILNTFVASTGPVDLLHLPTHIDGFELKKNFRVLLKDQVDKTQNGIYKVLTPGVSWIRSEDANTDIKFETGDLVWVYFGTQNINTGWVLTSSGPFHLGSTDLTYENYDPTKRGIGVSGEKYVSVVPVTSGKFSNSSVGFVTVGVVEFTPTIFILTGATLLLTFEAVTRMAGAFAGGEIKLRNLSDSDDILTTSFSTTSYTTLSQDLVIGTNPGEVRPSSKLYAVQISTDTGGVAAEVYSSRIKITNTII